MSSFLGKTNPVWITALFLSAELHTCSFYEFLRQFSIDHDVVLDLFYIQGLFRTQSVEAAPQHRSSKKGRAGANVIYLQSLFLVSL